MTSTPGDIDDESHQRDHHCQAIYELFVAQNWGARRLKRLMDEAGEERSLMSTQVLLHSSL